MNVANIYDQEGPLALLQKQHKLEKPWILEEIRRHIGFRAEILDVGCSTGYLSNALALAGHKVTGIDLSPAHLKTAEARDPTHSVKYLQGNGYHLPFASRSFDVVASMDQLQHVSDPQQILAEAARVLRPGGLFFFDTFNKNLLSWLVVIKGMETFVKDTPPQYNVYSLFLEPHKVGMWMEDVGLETLSVRGVRPVFLQKAMFQLLSTGEVSKDFRFTFSKSSTIGYSGVAKKSYVV